MRCRFHTNGQTCEREARANWTTCDRHSTAGMNRRQWIAAKAQKAKWEAQGGAAARRCSRAAGAQE